MGKRKYSPEFVKDQMAKWDRPFLPSMNDDESKIFRDRVKAIELYAENMNVAEIEAQTGIKRNSIVRLFEKGMIIAADGKPFGYRALLPYSRVAKPLVGKMQTVFNLHDGLEKRVLDFYFSCDAGRAMKHPDKRTTFKYFITELEIAGHDTQSYPFNLTDGGYRTFVDWLDKKEVEKNMYLARQRNEAKVEDAKTGSENKIMHPTRPYQLIEIDGHRLDLLYAIKTYDAEGNVHYRPAERPWLLAAIDIATRCVVSYRVVFESEYNSADVMKLLEGAILPYKGFPNIRSDGMPSEVFAEACYAMPELVLLDNALAHYAEDITEKVSEYGFQLGYGPVADPTKRPHIERFFETLEKRWLHKLPSTTGSNPTDIVRINAEKDAIDFGYTREDVEYTIALCIATYNNTVHSEIGMTPIGKMRQLLNMGYVPNRLAESLRAGFKMYCKRERTFRGNKKYGKHVYVQLNNFKYTSDRISGNYNLVGQEAVLLVDPDNICVIHAFSGNVSLGPLYMKGAEKNTEGGLSARQGKAVHDYLREEGIKKTFGLDDAETYILSLQKEPKGKADLRKLQNISTVLPEKVIPPDMLDKESDIEEVDDELTPEENENSYIQEERDISFDQRTKKEKRESRRKKYGYRYGGGRYK